MRRERTGLPNVSRFHAKALLRRFMPRPSNADADTDADALIRYQAARLAAMTQALARTSHDLRGVLSPTLLAAERLENSPEPATRRAGEIMVRAVERATEVIQATLETAREGAQPVRVRALLRDIVAEAAAATGVEVTHDLTDDVLGQSDPARVAEALAELFGDAAARGARCIRLSRPPDNERAVVVTDDGAALDTGLAVRPFQPNAPDYRRATARELVRGQGGDITLEATSPGATVYLITLPGLLRRRT